jgi:hypothetical protein
MITEVFECDAPNSSIAYIEFDGGTVRFDCSDGEYGPIEFDINILIDALEKHAQCCMDDILKKYGV